MRILGAGGFHSDILGHGHPKQLAASIIATVDGYRAIIQLLCEPHSYALPLR